MTLVTPAEVIRRGRLKIEKSRLKEVASAPVAAPASRVKFDLRFSEDTLCFPGLINVHDHLRGNYLPRIGPSNGDYYLNWSYWEKDLRSSPVLEERARIGVEDMYSLSAYKNLLSGVVTVNDHFPHEFNEPFLPFLPIRVINAYTLAHECSSYDLKWGDGIEIEHQRAVERGHPFITHLEEGFDEESQAGVEILERLSCLDSHDLFIHCIGFCDEDIRKVKGAGASVAWCPASNIFMFNVTCKIRRMLAEGVNVCIGTDSTATGSVNLLEEMRFARRTYGRMYGEELPARTVTEMVTRNPARAFWMQDRIGSIEEGKLADLLFLRPRVSDPYEALLQAQIEDIELILREGSPLYGDQRWEELFRQRGVKYTRAGVRGRSVCVRGDPAGLLAKVRDAVGFKKVLDYLPLDG
jgi:5-methylthioadenosine/S-adenosylhomocysteine deaminase